MKNLGKIRNRTRPDFIPYRFKWQFSAIVLLLVSVAAVKAQCLKLDTAEVVLFQEYDLRSQSYHSSYFWPDTFGTYQARIVDDLLGFEGERNAIFSAWDSRFCTIFQQLGGGFDKDCLCEYFKDFDVPLVNSLPEFVGGKGKFFSAQRLEVVFARYSIPTKPEIVLHPYTWSNFDERSGTFDFTLILRIESISPYSADPKWKRMSRRAYRRIVRNQAMDCPSG